MGSRVSGREQLLTDYVAARWTGLVRLAFLLTGDPTRAEDLVQTALVKVCARIGHVRDPQALDAYVRRTLVNASINASRRRWRGELPTGDPPGAVGADDYQRSDDRDQLITALRTLTPRQQAAVVLRFYEDLSERDAAAALGCAPGTVKSLTSRGLSALREQLGTRYSDEGQGRG